MTDENAPSPIQLGQATIEAGQPQLAPRSSGPIGAKGSRYDHVLDKLPELKPGPDGGYVKATLEQGTDAEKAIGALRVAIKRRFGKEEALKLKVRKLADNSVGVFRV